MSDRAVPAKLAGFAVVLLATFGAAFGIGQAVGPVGDEPAAGPGPSVTTTTMAMDHGGNP